MIENYTIAAIATPLGKGGIHIIRLSGKEAFSILKKLTVKQNYKARELVLTTLTPPLKDKIMAVIFPSPQSYTGEDVAEIHCHGSSYIASEILKKAIENGARPAEGGEFTMRAFINGKITLDEAEGIIDLINSSTAAQMRAAFDLSEGAIKNKIEDMQKLISSLNAKCLVAIDYPDEDVEDITKKDLKKELEKLNSSAESLTESYAEGRIIKDGVKIAIIGEPNSGKSALLNALTGYERAIVSDEAGTTRDTVDAEYEYSGIKFIITDTAGIRETGNNLEKKGIERSKQKIEESDMVLALSEIGKEFNLDIKLKDSIQVKTKLDLYKKESFITEEDKVYVSALTGEGIERLKKVIYEKTALNTEKGATVITNARHYYALTKAKEYLCAALANIEKVTLDCITSDLTFASEELGKITGTTASERLISEIFSKFCVGK